MKYIITFYNSGEDIADLAIEYATEDVVKTISPSRLHERLVLRGPGTPLEGRTLEEAVKIINRDLEDRYRTITLDF